MPDFLEWRAEQTSFQDLAAFYTGTVNVTAGDGAHRFNGGFMAANSFSLLGVRPALGRGFVEGEDRPGSPRALILGDDVWRDRFGSDPAVIGQAVRVNGEAATIIGVMPPGFRFPEAQEVWTNLPLDPAGSREGGSTVGAYGKLREGVTVERARAELSEIAHRIEEVHPDTNEGLEPLVTPYTENFIGDPPHPSFCPCWLWWCWCWWWPA